MKTLSKIALLGLSTTLLLGACGGDKTTVVEETAKVVEQVVPTVSAMDAAIAGEWRVDQAKRDKFRNPKPTLEFFGLAPGQSVVEISPGGGWYTGVLAPYIKQAGGTYTAAVFEAALGERYVAANTRFLERYADSDVFGQINTVEFGPTSGPMGDGSFDLVLSFRNVHNWMGAGYADKAFADFYASLKPGGVLGIVEHRLPESAEQNPKASSGYVQVSYTKDLAKKAGFEFVGASEINANPKDTADHPYGVWTLLPSSRTPREGEDVPEGFDADAYVAVGESDRYTLKFRKPE
ncbi:MAG: class I SAM-dependent methyltransferase [Robiginitomaculum sp.]|nr:class I SAM-dependent methyltransferase [Robiginitomaculum sp.]